MTRKQTIIAHQIKSLQAELPDRRRLLIAVTKTVPVEKIQKAYEAGCKDFGENKVQELIKKQPHLPKDIRWHMIGHLQSNKVKHIASFIHTIHSVDGMKLLREINKQAEKYDKVISCLLQIKIAQEESKYGMSFEEAEALLKSDEIQHLKNIRIIGFMGMATYTSDEQQIRKEFSSLRRFFETMKEQSFPENVRLEELSMGMSSDYPVALEEGSTMIRVGSLIFGVRN